MDPISAFGLAVNILTVIDLSVKVISTASEIRSYGESITTRDRAVVAQHFESRCEKLIESTKASSIHSDLQNHAVISNDDDGALHQLAEEAKAIARDIQHGLFRRQTGQTLLKSLRDAVSSVWGEREMKEKTQRLKEMRSEIQSGLMVSIKASIDAAGFRWNEMSQNVDDSTQHIIGTLLSDNDTIRSDMERRVEELNQEVISHFDLASHLASQRHDELLNAIAGGSGLATSAVSENPAKITDRILGKLWFTTIDDSPQENL
ncbi:hypothetical protein COL26b_000587 [Colletotrichum chrysophilum]|uniref:uncharacterized protein n=1 Tax=Colletotrichum chrysophilum TaxID=1836956 RepID=UPI002301A63F|nr:uncharacterized protein COL26b_000587 [Colletotrichum chrysophilum]KAJ0381243.1 hypothetical protein COL26b_000587 [Colletotrichum chrysophilum]